MLDQLVVDLLGLVLLFVVVGVLPHDDLLGLGEVLQFLLEVDLLLPVEQLIALHALRDMQHHLFDRIALLPLDFYVLQALLQVGYLLLCLLLLVDVLVSLDPEPLPLDFQGLDLVLLLVPHLHDVVVFLADAQHDAVGGDLGEVVGGLGLLPELTHVPAGGEGEVVVSGWAGVYLTLLLMALRAGSLKV